MSLARVKNMCKKFYQRYINANVYPIFSILKKKPSCDYFKSED